MILPTYAYWHFDDFSWGDTRQTAGEIKGAGKGGHEGEGEFDSSKITMKRWGDFEQERRLRQPRGYEGQGSGAPTAASSYGYTSSGHGRRGHERTPSNLAYEYDYP